MFEESTRPITEDERRECTAKISNLLAESARARKRYWTWFFATLAWCAFPLGSYLTGLGEWSAVAALVFFPAAFTSAIAMLGWIDARNWGGSTYLKTIEETIRTGQVCVLNVKAESVIAINSFDGESWAFLFDVGDNRSLLFANAFPDTDADEIRPYAQFQFVGSLDKCYTLSLKHGENRLEPERVLEDEDLNEAYYDALEMKVYEGKPAEVIQRWLRSPGS